jgi:hypothetical protein
VLKFQRTALPTFPQKTENFSQKQKSNKNKIYLIRVSKFYYNLLY